MGESPEQFANIEEASEFWDTHDAGDYEQYLRPVREKLEVAADAPQSVLLDSALVEGLKRISRERGISVETLVNLWLQEKIKAM